MLPAQKDPPPVTLYATGVPVTATRRVAVQPVDGMVYDIVAVPAVSPFTTPEDEPMVATAVLLLVQLPPLVASLSVVVLPMQRLAVPVMADSGSMVMLCVT